MARLHALLRLAVRPMCSPQHFVARRAASSKHKSMKVLGIETSADDTCVALMYLRADEIEGDVGSLATADKVTYDNKKHGGIHPVEAVKSHTENLSRMVSSITSKYEAPPDLICVTRGPGMGGCLSIGVSTAKALSDVWKVPIVGVHHMQAHALTPAMESTTGYDLGGKYIAYPFLTLLVSGKHTMLVHTKSPVNHRILAQTQGTALGDALDKVARELVPSSVIESQPDCLPICYPHLLEQMTKGLCASYLAPGSREDEIKPYKSDFGWTLQPPLRQTREMKYDFNGLASQTLSALRANPEMSEAERQVLGNQFMRLAFEHLTSRVIIALQEDEDLLRDPPKDLVLSGGVASNFFLRKLVRKMLWARGFNQIKSFVPSRMHCTDNASMIAYTGWKMYTHGWETDRKFSPAVKWSIEEILSGVDCWNRRPGFPPTTPENAQREFLGPALATKSVVNTTQDPSPSTTKHEDAYPKESLLPPNDPRTSREMNDSRDFVETPSRGLDHGDPPLNRSKDAVNERTAEVPEEALELLEVPSASQEETTKNDLAESPETEPKEAKPSSKTSKDVKAANSSSNPTKKTASVNSQDLPGQEMDEVNLKLEQLMKQADSILDTFTSDSRSRKDLAPENSQAALKAEDKRIPATPSTTSAAEETADRDKSLTQESVAPQGQSADNKVKTKESDEKRVAKEREQKQQQPATEKADAKQSATGPVSFEPPPLNPRRAPKYMIGQRALRPLPAPQLATQKADTKMSTTDPVSSKGPLNPSLLAPKSTLEYKGWPPVPAPKERHSLKVRRLGFADEPSPPASQSAPTFMSRLASMFGLGSK